MTQHYGESKILSKAQNRHKLSDVYDQQLNITSEELDGYKIRELIAQGYSIYDLPLKVVWYARVSTNQEDQLHSLKAQLQFFNRYLKDKPNWIFVGEYVDEGITGTSTRRRKGFNQMIIDAENKNFHLILTKEVSRFARNTIDSLFYTRELLKYGVGVYFINDGFHTFEKDSELRLTIMSSLAQEESRKISERVKFGFRNSIKNGVVLGNSRIWGYRKNNGKLEIVEEEAKIVREIFELYAKGFGFRSIAQKLNEKGYRNGNGRKFGYSSISGIIRNPKYKGYYCGRKSTKVDLLSNERHMFSEDEWEMWKDETGEIVPAIVSEALWDKCNKILQQRREFIKEGFLEKVQNRYVLSGKIHCGTCNNSYWRTVYRYPKCEKVIWQCSEYRRYGKPNGKGSGCDNPHIYEHEVEFILQTILKNFLQDKKVMFDKLENIYQQIINEMNYDEDIKNLMNQIEQIKIKKDKLLDHNINGRISDEEFEKRNNDFNKQIETLQQQISEYEKLNDAKKDSVSTLKLMKKFMSTNNLFENGNNPSLEEMVRFVDKIIVYPSSFKNTIKVRVILKSGIETLSFYKKRSRNYKDLKDMRSSCITQKIHDECILKTTRTLNGKESTKTSLTIEVETILDIAI